MEVGTDRDVNLPRFTFVPFEIMVIPGEPQDEPPHRQTVYLTLTSLPLNYSNQN